MIQEVLEREILPTHIARDIVPPPPPPPPLARALSRPISRASYQWYVFNNKIHVKIIVVFVPKLSGSRAYIIMLFTQKVFRVCFQQLFHGSKLS